MQREEQTSGETLFLNHVGRHSLRMNAFYAVGSTHTGNDGAPPEMQYFTAAIIIEPLQD